MVLLLQTIKSRAVWITFFGQILFSLVWFAYIYGVLGHVCPVAFLGMWNAGLLGAAIILKKSPHFGSLLFTLLITAAVWVLAFFILHPVDFDNLVRWVNFPPFLAVLCVPWVTVFMTALLQMKEKPNKSPNSEGWQLKLAAGIEILLQTLIFIAAIVFLSVPSIKEGMYTDRTEWFDTLFFGWDVYYLFAFLAIQALVGAVFTCLGWVTQKRDYKRAFLYRIFGLSFWAFLGIGSLLVYPLLRQASPIKAGQQESEADGA